MKKVDERGKCFGIVINQLHICLAIFRGGLSDNDADILSVWIVHGKVLLGEVYGRIVCGEEHGISFGQHEADLISQNIQTISLVADCSSCMMSNVEKIVALLK